MVGDSATDIQAANAARVATIALVNKPEKAGLFQHLEPAPPDAIVVGMCDFARPDQRLLPASHRSHP